MAQIKPLQPATIRTNYPTRYSKRLMVLQS